MAYSPGVDVGWLDWLDWLGGFDNEVITIHSLRDKFMNYLDFNKIKTKKCKRHDVIKRQRRCFEKSR